MVDGASGRQRIALVGRVKVESRPLVRGCLEHDRNFQAASSLSVSYNDYFQPNYHEVNVGALLRTHVNISMIMFCASDLAFLGNFDSPCR